MGLRLRVIFLVALLSAGFLGVSRADDCKVRGYDGANILKFDCEPAGATTSPFRVTLADGSIRGIKLVDPEISGVSNSAASKFRVRYTDASGDDVIKAVGKILPGISSCEEFQMIGYHPAYPLNGTYQLGTGIDCSATNPVNSAVHAASLWGMGYYEYYQHKGFDSIQGNADDNLTALSQVNLGAQGFMPMGTTYSSSFSGTFDGNNKVIAGLFINRPSSSSSGLPGVGLFVYTSGPATIRNIGLVGGHITGDAYVGGFVANNGGAITNVYNTGGVSGTNRVGGLVGWNEGPITNSYNSGTVSCNGNQIGGLVGNNRGGITSSYNTGIVSGADYVGGLAGYLVSTIVNSYNTGAISGRYNVGGITGYAKGNPGISQSYNSGTVQGTLSVGGLIGYSHYSSISNSFNVGSVTGGCSGGLIGSSVDYNCSNCAWDTSTSAHVIEDRDAEGYLELLETSQGWNENSAAAFNGSSHGVYTSGPTPWNFTTVWKSSGTALPRLRWEE